MNFGDLIREIKKEFKNGCIKLLGWTIPTVVMTFIGISIYNSTINNNLKIETVRIEEKTDNMVLSPENPTRVKVLRVGEDDNDISNNFFSKTYSLSLKGYGQVKKAYYFNSYKEGEELDKTEMLVKGGNLISRIVSVSPSEFEMKLSFYFSDKGQDNIRRTYIVFQNSGVEDLNIFLMLVNGRNHEGEYRIVSESELNSMIPNDPNIKNEDIYLSTHLKEIKKDLDLIKSHLK